jgi:uncharacterized membrane protein YqjE
MLPPNPSFKSMVNELAAQTMRLLRAELRLAQAESREKLSQVVKGIVSILVALLLAFCALLILAQALVIALSAEVMPAWMASLAVAVALALVGGILVAVGARKLRAEGLRPDRTIRTLRAAGAMVEEKVQRPGLPSATRQVA